VTEFSVPWWVSPDGSPTGKGTREQPWDIETALSHPSGVEPGDVIWVQGGVYRPARTLSSTLAGSAARPIVVRVEPGSRAVLDFVNSVDRVCLHVQGGHTWYWGLEITSSSVARWSDAEGSDGDPRGTGILSEGGPVGTERPWLVPAALVGAAVGGVAATWLRWARGRRDGDSLGATVEIAVAATLVAGAALA
jgi:hypothetical protein